MKYYVTGLLLFFLVTAVQANTNTQAVDWLTYSDAAFEKARQANRPVLVELSAEWCTFCKKMDAITYKNEEVVKSINEHYIPVRVVDEHHPEIAKKYEKYGRPAMVILDADGNEIFKRRGYIEPKFMFWMLEAVAQNPVAEAHQ